MAHLDNGGWWWAQVNLLDLSSHMIGTPASSPAAKNRFIYLSDRQKPGLTPIPSTLLGHLTSRLSMLTLPSVIREPLRKANRPETTEWDDESFDSILSRRFGPELARVLGSSVIHGIYAADSRKLSVRSAMAPVWEAERRGDGSIVKGLLRSRSMKKTTLADGYDTGGLEQSVKDLSVYSFRNGVSTLTDALKSKLEALSNVEIHTGSGVNNLQAMDGSFEACLLLITAQCTSHGSYFSSFQHRLARFGLHTLFLPFLFLLYIHYSPTPTCRISQPIPLLPSP